ncbi:MAG: 2,4'-dihydroxyacetophenone dioxygenase family protein [Acidobacteriota bacterium]
MSKTESQQYKQSLPAFLPARALADDAVPWIPLSQKKFFKPLRFLSGNRGFVELLRLEPGEVIPLHRHTGEVHAFNLEGSRQLHTGELIGPGDYVYEPAGNIDTWKVVGDTPLVIFVVVMGTVEYLGPDHTVTGYVTADTLKDLYHQHCAANHVEPLDLVD